MIERVLQYEVDGETFESCFYCEQRNDPVPGVLVIPDIIGLREQAKDKARRLAQIGYAALAMDLHGRQRTLDRAEVMPTLERFYFDTGITIRRAMASVEAFSEQPEVNGLKLGAIGFCYGGTLALEMARSGFPFQAVVGFHSVLRSSLDWAPEALRSRILVCVGAEDPEIPVEDRRAFETEMRKTSSDWQLHVYGGVYHSFTDPRIDEAGVPDFARYNEVADRRSWSAMEDILERAFA